MKRSRSIEYLNTFKESKAKKLYVYVHCALKESNELLQINSILGIFANH
jgi:hypothetical protein